MWPGCDHWYAMVWPNGSKWPFLIWDGDVHWFRTNQNQNHGFSNFEVPKNADSTSFRFKHVKHVDCLFFMGAFANSRFLSGAFRRRSLRRSILLNVMRRPYSGANLGDQPPLDPADLSQRDPTVRVFFWTRGLRVVVGDPKISIDIPSRRLSHAIVKDSNRSTTVALLTIERVDVVATIPKNWENRW